MYGRVQLGFITLACENAVLLPTAILSLKLLIFSRIFLQFEMNAVLSSTAILSLKLYIFPNFPFSSWSTLSFSSAILPSKIPNFPTFPLACDKPGPFVTCYFTLQKSQFSEFSFKVPCNFYRCWCSAEEPVASLVLYSAFLSGISIPECFCLIGLEFESFFSPNFVFFSFSLSLPELSSFSFFFRIFVDYIYCSFFQNYFLPLKLSNVFCPPAISPRNGKVIPKIV